MISPKFSVDSDTGHDFGENAFRKLKPTLGLSREREKINSDPSREEKPNSSTPNSTMMKDIFRTQQGRV